MKRNAQDAVKDKNVSTTNAGVDLCIVTSVKLPIFGELDVVLFLFVSSTPS